MRDWETFAWEMMSLYNFDVSGVSDAYAEEQEEYYVGSSAWIELQPAQILGQAVAIKTLDLNTCSLTDALGVDRTTFAIKVPYHAQMSGFAGWFDVDFTGSASRPLTNKVTLSTAPDVGYTHWGQQVFTICGTSILLCWLLRCLEQHRLDISSSISRHQYTTAAVPPTLSYHK
jgi:protein arginine N-methyltransferase 1